jgi:CopG family nickel-responsive transcriptional regulator
MERLTITLDDELLADVDRHASARAYQSRSEAVRDLVRTGLQQLRADGSEPGERIAAIMYVYDHRIRELAKRLTRAFHHEHDLSLASLHVHLDAETCMEVAVVRGSGNRVRRFADHLIAERGVRYGRVFTVPAPRRKKGGKK